MFTKIASSNPIYNQFVQDVQTIEECQKQLNESTALFNNARSVLFDRQRWTALKDGGNDAPENVTLVLDHQRLEAQAQLLNFVVKSQIAFSRSALLNLQHSACSLKAHWNDFTASESHVIASQYCAAVIAGENLSLQLEGPRYDPQPLVAVFHFKLLCDGGTTLLDLKLPSMSQRLPERLPVGIWHGEQSQFAKSIRKLESLTGGVKAAVAELRSQKGILDCVSEKAWAVRAEFPTSSERVKAEATQRQRSILVNSLRIEADILQEQLLSASRDILVLLTNLLERELSTFAESGQSGYEQFTKYLLENWNTSHYDVFNLAATYLAAHKASLLLPFELTKYEGVYQTLRQYVEYEYSS